MRDRLIGERITRSRKSILLLGPRQVGKSTLCRALPHDLYVDLADQSEFLSFAKDAGRLRREVLARNGRGLVVIDEIQRVPALLNTVQSLIDQFQPRLKFVLTGSSARKLKHGDANLLPGRIILERLDPLSVMEIGERIDVDRGLRLGMLPGIYWGDDEATAVLGTYTDIYLQEEIRAEALAKDIGGYARFLDVMGIASGQWINYSKLSSDSEIPKETLRRFVQLLDDTLLAIRLPPFRPNRSTSRRLLQRHRVLLFDVGVRNALLGLHRHGLSADQLGTVFEQWAILQVVYLSRAGATGWKLSSYRSEAGAEVDLVIERDHDVVGLEIKSGRSVGAADTRGLLSLESLVDPKKPLRKWIAYRGDRRQRFDNGVEAWPVLDVLQALAADAGVK